MVIYLGSLVQSCCGEGGKLQTNITGMCRKCSQCLGHTGFAPAHSVCGFPVYAAQAPGCSAGELSKVGPGLCALPRSKQLRQPGAWRLHSPQVGSASYQIPCPSCSVSWMRSRSAVSGVLCVSSGELISGCDPPGGCQPSRIPGRLA